MIRIRNYIGGMHCDPENGQWMDVVEPATGEVFAALPDSGEEDISNAVEAAKHAFPTWSGLRGEERFRHLMNLAEGIRNRFDEFAMAETRDNGKPISLSRNVDIPRAIKNFEFYASAAQHFGSESHYTEGLGINYTLRHPLGVVGCISPWNLPLYLFSWKIAPALAAGNCVVAKPSEITPYTAYLLSEVMNDIEFPKGVLNIVHGRGASAGDAITHHPDIAAISFTGGTETGRRILSVAGPKLKKLSLELGGKNPNLIFADCDFDEMLKTTLRSSFSNQGQICLCGSRILIEDSLYDRFREAFAAKVAQMKVGDPFDPETRTGAVVSEAHMNKILGYIDLAKREGGTILCGGHRVEIGGGYYVQPTVIEGLDQTCRTNREEIFGPVVTLDRFSSEAEAIAKANSVEYGLSATVWTSDLSRAHRVAGRVEAGMVWVNCWLERDLRTPFGGVKHSGMGREGD